MIFCYTIKMSITRKDTQMTTTNYLITDPCYVVPTDEWDSFVDAFYGNGDRDVTPWEIDGLGTIIEVDNTAYGDGSARMSGKKEVLVDSGTVCIVKLNEGVTPTDYQGNAVTNREDVARKWYEKAKQI